MRRTVRWTWNAVVVASLLLCFATCVLWARSYYGTDRWVVAGQRRVDIQTGGGQFLAVTYSLDDPRWVTGPTEMRHERDPTNAAVGRFLSWSASVSDPRNPFVVQPARPYFLGFWIGGHNNRAVPDVTSTMVAGSLGSLALGLAILPMIWTAKWWRRRRARSSRPGGFPVEECQTNPPSLVE